MSRGPCVIPLKHAPSQWSWWWSDWTDWEEGGVSEPRYTPKWLSRYYQVTHFLHSNVYYQCKLNPLYFTQAASNLWWARSNFLRVGTGTHGRHVMIELLLHIELQKNVYFFCHNFTIGHLWGHFIGIFVWCHYVKLCHEQRAHPRAMLTCLEYNK